jgi:hypothetical protein
VVLEHELLIQLLVEVTSDPLMLLVDVGTDFVEPLLDDLEVVVKFRLDDVLVVVDSIQVDRCLDHLLELGEAIVALLGTLESLKN